MDWLSLMVEPLVQDAPLPSSPRLVADGLANTTGVGCFMPDLRNAILASSLAWIRCRWHNVPHLRSAELAGLGPLFDAYLWRNYMKKRLQNLERLYQKMQHRYGDDDELVMQLKHEIELHDNKPSKNHATANIGRRLQDKERSFIPEH
jgi:hypothetical protein